jgi:hypothetical protein
MSGTRLALLGGLALLGTFLVLGMAFTMHAGVVVVVVAAVALAALVGAGNLLYGRRSHYARAQARRRPAQQARDRAADVAAEARRAVAAANRRGERYCPLDPVHQSPDHSAERPDQRTAPPR